MRFKLCLPIRLNTNGGFCEFDGLSSYDSNVYFASSSLELNCTFLKFKQFISFRRTCQTNFQRFLSSKILYRNCLFCFKISKFLFIWFRLFLLLPKRMTVWTFLYFILVIESKSLLVHSAYSAKKIVFVFFFKMFFFHSLRHLDRKFGTNDNN